MQDGVSCHTKSSVKQFLEVHKIPVLKWPTNLSDMNLMKNIWVIYSKQMKTETIIDLINLIEQLIYVWNRDEELHNAFQNCSDSKLRHINAQIKGKGEPSK